MNGERAPVGWRVWLWWVLATAVGWSVGGYLGSAAGWGLSRGIAVVGYGAGAAAGGIAAGVLQWLVLRQQVARAGWWVLASTVAGAVIGVVGVVVGAAVGFGVRWVDGGPETTGPTAAGTGSWVWGWSSTGPCSGCCNGWCCGSRSPGRAGGCWLAPWAGL